MVGIALEAGEHRSASYNFEQFERTFLEICEKHRATGRALAFAFILYDGRQPQISKVLRDSDYWHSLDKLSGKDLTVFSFTPSPTVTVGRSGYMYNVSDGVPFRTLVNVGDGSDPDAKNRLILGRYFALRHGMNLPAILFFQVHNGEVMGSELWCLQEEKVEDAFLEIKKAIGIAVSAVQNVIDENRNNSQEVFALIQRALLEQRLKMQTFKGLRVLKGGVKDIALLIKLLMPRS